MLPKLNAEGFLDPGSSPYPATLEEIKELFVDQAPYQHRRAMIYRALHLFTDLVWETIPEARFWINGGFTTHKSWAAPEDADVVAIVPVKKLKLCLEDSMLPLSTLQHVTAAQPNTQTPKLHPFGGLLDTFFIPDMPAQLRTWDDTWSKVKGPDNKIIAGKRKGYLEVTP